MDSGQKFLRCVAAVLFITLCAYLGAGVNSLLQPAAKTVNAEIHTVTETVSLEGVALRSECLLLSEEDFSGPENGSRLRAGTVLQLGNTALRLQQSAFYYSNFDGFEYLSPPGGDLTVSAVNGILSFEPSPTEKAVGRLVSSSAWYYAALCSAQCPLKPGDGCALLFEGFEDSISGRLCAVSPPEGGKQALLLRMTGGSAAHYSLRHCRAQLLLSPLRGLRLPVSALLKDEDGNEFVYVLRGGLVQKRSVDIIYTDPAGQWCLSALSDNPDGLSEGCAVFCSGTDIDEGSVFT